MVGTIPYQTTPTRGLVVFDERHQPYVQKYVIAFVLPSANNNNQNDAIIFVQNREG
jgi:hypothetical protein